MHSLPAKQILLTLCLWIATYLPVAAQKPPELGYVYPPTLVPGETTEVQLGGFDFTGDMQFFVYDPQVKLQVKGKPGRFLVPEPPYWFGEKGRSNAFPIPREVSATLKVAQTHPPGLVHWQVANANGSSATAVFYVSDTPEVTESRYRDEPQPLSSLPVGVSGRLSKIAEIDRYTFQARQDGPITVELFARTLGADFNGVIEVRDAAGKVVADAADTEGIDTALTWAAIAGRHYTVHLHDVDFRGNRAFVYRLAITPGPRVVATVPAMGQRGSTCDVKFIGYGIATGQPRLETVTQQVTFPEAKDVAKLRYRLETKFGSTPPFEIPLSDHPEQVAATRSDAPQELNTPLAVTGKLTNAPADFDWTATKGDVFEISAQSRAIRGRLDLSLEVRDASGKVLASNDDFAGSVDPSIVFTAPADGTYTCRVNDLSGRSNRIDSIYRLALVQQQPGYVLTVPQRISAKVGSTAKLQVTARRSGGHSAPIPIRIEGLPNGISAPSADKLIVPAGKSQLGIDLQIDEKCAALAVPLRVSGKTEGQAEVVATAPAAGNLCPHDFSDNQLNQILLTTTLSPTFSVELVDKNRQRAVHRGTTYPAPFLIKRDEGFEGEIRLQMLAKQGRHRQGIDAPVLLVPQGATQVLYPCYMPEWLETDRTTRMVVLGVGQQTDPAGNVREVTKQADARVTMILEGALLQVSHKLKELTVNAGDSFEIPVVVSRSAKLSVPVKLQVIVPAELKDLVQLRPQQIELPTSQSQVTLRLVTSKQDALKGRWPLTIQATALQDGRWRVVSQTKLSVQFDN